mgnify:CR=1 FL=1
MKPLQVYILEDEIITQEVLKQTLESLDYNVCGMQTNAEKALEEIKQLAPDIVLLDIRVKGEKTGIWLGNQLDIPIIYLTAFSDQKNIKEAALTTPVSYIQKPFNEKDLFIALELAKNKLNENKELIIRNKNLKVIVKIKDILYAKKEDQYLSVHLNDKKHLMRITTKSFLDMVTNDFIQVHRSYIINKNFVSGFSNKLIKINDIEIPISLSYLKNVQKELQ